MPRTTLTIILLAAAILTAGCRTTSVPTFTSDDQVGLARTATHRFVERQRASGASISDRQLVFLAGIDNKSGITIGPGLDFAWQGIAKELTNSNLYTVLDRQSAEVAMLDAGLPRNDYESLVSEKRRDRVIEQLGKNSIFPDYILWGVYTAALDPAGKRHYYGFTLRGVDLETNQLISIESGESVR